MRVIGVTGGIGSGKSTLLTHIAASHNSIVISADSVARLLCEPGQVCHVPMLTLLGRDILDDEGKFKRHQMAKLVFGNPKLRSEVNAIIHPQVKEYIETIIATEAKRAVIDFLFIEAALLIEDEYDKIVNELWYIYASEATRRRRVMESRGYSSEAVSSIIECQLSEQEFRERCQVVIDNEDGIEKALSQVEAKLRK
ncbi:MAG: dephospho-CoA kinase [Lachnospiraceae bacterium]|jgi:dephospho-CoA kinase|nr:dephospho-CoA kinase [Lachnospiraceae bacterium]